MSLKFFARREAIRLYAVFFTAVVTGLVFTSVLFYNKTVSLTSRGAEISYKNSSLSAELAKTKIDLKNLQNQDQYLINQELTKTINGIETTYTKTVELYEKLLDLKTISKKTETFDASYAATLETLSKHQYATAEGMIGSILKSIEAEKEKIISSYQVPTNISTSNSLPGAGYSRQLVNTDSGSFVINIIAADLNNTKVIVDTASDSDCSNNCPVLSLGDYVSRNNAIAGINGTYFCPASYPSCAGKTNSFEFLVMNKNKHYFNSDHNVYSVVPAVIFSGNSARYVAKTQEWGRDTSVDAVISNFPLLLVNDQIAFAGSDEPKLQSRGIRSFIGTKNNMVYIGFVENVTPLEEAKVLKAMGMNGALNLDEGGSSALWYGGYKIGPGRSVPNAVLFVRR